VVGVALAIGASRVMSSVIYGVAPLDWTSLIVSTVLLGMTGTGAAFLPVWRATRIDPVTILRSE
jgi:ABC-type antimicrobial peptide transport system permease subunit